MLTYKGYIGKVSFDDEAEIFHGEVCGLRDVVTFQATAAAEVKQAFQASIDDYLEFCEQTRQPPDKPFSGKFIVRIPAELHRDLHNLAAAQEVSLNSLVVRILDQVKLDP